MPVTEDKKPDDKLGGFTDYKQKYSSMKNELKTLLYENELFQDELQKLQRELLDIYRDKEKLLEKIIQTEDIGSSSSDSESLLGDNVHEIDSFEREPPPPLPSSVSPALANFPSSLPDFSQVLSIEGAIPKKKTVTSSKKRSRSPSANATAAKKNSNNCNNINNDISNNNNSNNNNNIIIVKNDNISSASSNCVIHYNIDMNNIDCSNSRNKNGNSKSNIDISKATGTKSNTSGDPSSSIGNNKGLPNDSVKKVTVKNDSKPNNAGSRTNSCKTSSASKQTVNSNISANSKPKTPNRSRSKASNTGGQAITASKTCNTNAVAKPEKTTNPTNPKSRRRPITNAKNGNKTNGTSTINQQPGSMIINNQPEQQAQQHQPVPVSMPSCQLQWQTNQQIIQPTQQSLVCSIPYKPPHTFDSKIAVNGVLINSQVQLPPPQVTSAPNFHSAQQLSVTNVTNQSPKQHDNPYYSQQTTLTQQHNQANLDQSSHEDQTDPQQFLQQHQQQNQSLGQFSQFPQQHRLVLQQQQPLHHFLHQQPQSGFDESQQPHQLQPWHQNQNQQHNVEPPQYQQTHQQVDFPQQQQQQPSQTQQQQSHQQQPLQQQPSLQQHESSLHLTPSEQQLSAEELEQHLESRRMEQAALLLPDWETSVPSEIFSTDSAIKFMAED